jgi:hypothetical protein
MDVALWMSPDVLRHKLAARDERNPEAAWNVSRLPAGLGRPGAVDRLFVASAGAWRGWCALAPRRALLRRRPARADHDPVRHAHVDRDPAAPRRKVPRTPRPDRGRSAGARGSAALKETL